MENSGANVSVHDGIALPASNGALREVQVQELCELMVNTLKDRSKWPDWPKCDNEMFNKDLHLGEFYQKMLYILLYGLIATHIVDGIIRKNLACTGRPLLHTVLNLLVWKKYPLEGCGFRTVKTVFRCLFVLLTQFRSLLAPLAQAVFLKSSLDAICLSLTRVRKLPNTPPTPLQRLC